MTPSPVIDLADGFDANQEKLRVKSPGFCLNLTRKALRLEQEAGELHFVLDSRDPEVLLDRLLSTRGDHFSVLLSVFYAGDTPVLAGARRMRGAAIDVARRLYPTTLSSEM